MLNEEPTWAEDFDLACVSETVAAGLTAEWATDADRVYAAGRVRSLMALAALRALLFRATGRRDWVVVRAGSGKPSVRGADGRVGPSVSVSHTAGLIAVTMARDVAVGIDVERHRPRDFSALANEAFGAAERREVTAGGAEAFYRIWTLREAMAKATGDGLGMVLNRADLADVPGRWGLLQMVPAPGYSLGVAWLGGRSGLAPRWVALG